MDFLERFGQAAASALQFHFSRYRFRWISGIVSLVFLGIVYIFLFSAPSHFPSGSIVAVGKGSSARDVAQELGTLQVVRYPAFLYYLLRVSGTGNEVQAGSYRFASPENLFVIAHRLAEGDFGIPPLHIRFPEGDTVRDMSLAVEDQLGIPASQFVSAAGPYEGYLFPDTYVFPPSVDVISIVEAMRSNFSQKITPLDSAILASGHSLSDIIIMASLVEKEARTSADRKMIAGILWNRIQKSMPLQVDAVFGYIYGRDTYSPSFADLEVDSPYNTYTHKGLPPGPIGNPGLVSIDAALHPTKSSYLFYLTGRDGNMYYATTYAGQLANQKKYLR